MRHHWTPPRVAGFPVHVGKFVVVQHKKNQQEKSSCHVSSYDTTSFQYGAIHLSEALPCSDKEKDTAQTVAEEAMTCVREETTLQFHVIAPPGYAARRHLQSCNQQCFLCFLLGQPCERRRQLRRENEYDFVAAAEQAEAEEFERKLSKGYYCPSVAEKFLSTCFPNYLQEAVKDKRISGTCVDAILGGTKDINAYIV